MGSDALFQAGPDDRFLRQVLGDVTVPQTPEKVSEGVRYLIESLFAGMFTQNMVQEAIL